MKFAFTHLSGNLKGQTQYFDRQRMTLGSAPDNDLVFPADGTTSGIPQRVEVVRVNSEIHVKNQDPTVTILVNHNPLLEARLEDRDLLQLGPEGPKLRFRIRPDDYASYKEAQEIWRDTLDVVAESKKTGLGTISPFLGQLTYEVRHYASRGTRLVLLALGFLVLSGLLGAVVFLTYTLQKDYERDLAILAEELESTRLTQAALEQRTAEERRRLKEALTTRQAEFDRLIARLEEQQRAGFGVSTEEVKTLKKRLAALESSRTRADVFIKQYGPSVCFLYIAYGFFVDGKPKVVPSVPVEYMGTGFLVNRKGHVATNRHIVEPWTMDPAAMERIEAGVEPRLLALLAYFPGHPQPFTMSVIRISDKGDVALGQLSPVPEGISPIPISNPSKQVKAGEPVVVLGYPVGVEALLARMNDHVVDALLGRSGRSLKRLVQDIADRNGIRPLATQGHIGDVVPGRIIYDAQTTGGASGSPVINAKGEVVAVNAAVMTRFGGANSGIPIELVLGLLAPPKD